MLHNPESRLTSGSGQDRSVKRKIYARTTDKGFQNGRIYSLISRHNKAKRELRKLAVVLQDDYCPSSNMQFHNTKYITLFSHKDRKFPGAYEDFRMFFDQDAEIAKLQWAGAMVCSSPRLQGAMTALTA